jgi:four helix bundle protein
VHPFEKLLVWQRSHALAVRVYAATAPWRDFAFRDQLRRAAVSVPANLAEGAAAASGRYFAKHIGIALSSATELRALILLARDVSQLEATTAAAFDQEAEELRRMLIALRKRVVSRENAAPR